MAELYVEIISPERTVYSQAADLVVVPGADGQLGVLPAHTRLFAQLVEGEVKIVKGGEEFFLAIGGGFIDVSLNKVTILVTRAVAADEINEQEVLAAKAHAEELLRSTPEGGSLEAAHAAFQRSLLELRVLRRHKKYTA